MGNQWFLSNQILLNYHSHSKIWSYNFHHPISVLLFLFFSHSSRWHKHTHTQTHPRKALNLNEVYTLVNERGYKKGNMKHYSKKNVINFRKWLSPIASKVFLLLFRRSTKMWKKKNKTNHTSYKFRINQKKKTFSWYFMSSNIVANESGHPWKSTKYFKFWTYHLPIQLAISLCVFTQFSGNRIWELFLFAFFFSAIVLTSKTHE